MIKAGARGYLHKDSAPQILEDAMRTIVEGKQYISAELTRLMIEEMAKDDNDLPHKSLSDREYEVLLYIGEGKTMTEIANQLSLSIKTVSTYRSRILEKMRLKSNSDLVKYILLHDLAPGGSRPGAQDGLCALTGLRTNPTPSPSGPTDMSEPDDLSIFGTCAPGTHLDRPSFSDTHGYSYAHRPGARHLGRTVQMAQDTPSGGPLEWTMWFNRLLSTDNVDIWVIGTTAAVRSACTRPTCRLLRTA